MGCYCVLLLIRVLAIPKLVFITVCPVCLMDHDAAAESCVVVI